MYKDDILKAMQVKNSYMQKKSTLKPLANTKVFEKETNYIKEPFYAWECVSLITTYRSIDFVIEDELCLMTFINYF